MRFRDALAQSGLTAIAEIKRRSPSAGDLRPDADPAALAAAYERASAAAVSVLVDERFAGSWDDLRAARASSRVPLLAKGFFSTADELRTAKDAGADAVLLLLRDLDDDLAAALMRTAADLGLDALVEAHDERELTRAVALGADPIGINARNLDTFVVDLQLALRLFANAPRERVLVAESGIETRADAISAELAGADSILVGSALMRAADPAEKLADLVRRPIVKVCGLTRAEDVAAAADAGADLAGFILAESPRRADRVLDVPSSMLSVAVLVGAPEEVDADLVQLYPREDRHRGRSASLFRHGTAVAAVVDLPWEQPDPTHYERARQTSGRVILAGGLAPENVRDAIATVRPWGVDAARSLETSPGIKDHARVRAFVEAARC